jgi:flagellar biogenesis protein FliO
MIFSVTRKDKSYSIFSVIIIFFVLVFVLCPIRNPINAEESISGDSKTEENQNKNSGNKKNEAENTLYNYEKPTVEEESYGWLIFKTIIVLGLLVGGFYYFYRFVTKKTGMHLVGRDVIKVLSIVPVGQNKFLQVIDLAGRIMVIGVSDSNINVITEIEDKDEADRIRLLSSKSAPVQPGGFQEYISKYISKYIPKLLGKEIHDDKAHDNYEIKYQDSETDRIDYLRKQRERLKKINRNDDEK